MAYSRTVFKDFIAGFKILVSSLEKLPDGHTFKNKILDQKFLLGILFLSDVPNLMATAYKHVQISSSLLWNYSKNIDHLATYADKYCVSTFKFDKNRNSC